MTTNKSKIGQADHGRRMSLADFEHAEVVPGRRYELGRGVIVVTDVPNPIHLALLTAIRRQLHGYVHVHAKRIHTIASGSECKILLEDLESERHPDLSVYKTAPPGDDSEVWAFWVPEIVVEVVSLGSEQRDYVEKREEYLRFGVLEYWIIDGARLEILTLTRRGGRWLERILRPGDLYQTRQLPGFQLNATAVFEAIQEQA
jgi:Uma2 family endonuclease